MFLSYSQVVQVIIYQERQSEAADSEVAVKIFVEFESYEEVKKAKEALNGRFFSGRKIHAAVYDQELYEQQDLSGWDDPPYQHRVTWFLSYY